MEIPNADYINSETGYLRGLVEAIGLKLDQIARSIGVAERTLKSYLEADAKKIDKKVPYVVQFTLECLAAPFEEENRYLTDEYLTEVKKLRRYLWDKDHRYVSNSKYFPGINFCNQKAILSATRDGQESDVDIREIELSELNWDDPDIINKTINQINDMAYTKVVIPLKPEYPGGAELALQLAYAGQRVFTGFQI